MEQSALGDIADLGAEQVEGPLCSRSNLLEADLRVDQSGQFRRHGSQVVLGGGGIGYQEIEEGLFLEKEAEGVVDRLDIEIGPGPLDDWQCPEILAFAPVILKQLFSRLIDPVGLDPTFLDNVQAADLRFTLTEDQGPFREEVDGAFPGEFQQRVPVQVLERQHMGEEVKGHFRRDIVDVISAHPGCPVSWGL